MSEPAKEDPSQKSAAKDKKAAKELKRERRAAAQRAKAQDLSLIHI